MVDVWGQNNLCTLPSKEALARCGRGDGGQGVVVPALGTASAAPRSLCLTGHPEFPVWS